MKILNKFYAFYANSKRKRYCKKLQKRLTNDNFSLITKNCVGGVIYHNLNKRFLSPTVNLFFEDRDFVLFCRYLKDFLKGSFKEISVDGVSYPVGELSCDKGTIKVYFMHYKTFEDAVEKWYDRAKRVNFDNLYFITEVNDNIDYDIVKEFNKLPYEHKAVISSNPEAEEKDGIYKINITEKYVNGVTLHYKSRFSAQRWLDDFDYVSFLNQK